MASAELDADNAPEAKEPQSLINSVTLKGRRRRSSEPNVDVKSLTEFLAVTKNDRSRSKEDNPAFGRNKSDGPTFGKSKTTPDSQNTDGSTFGRKKSDGPGFGKNNSIRSQGQRVKYQADDLYVDGMTAGMKKFGKYISNESAGSKRSESSTYLARFGKHQSLRSVESGMGVIIEFGRKRSMEDIMAQRYLDGMGKEKIIEQIGQICQNLHHKDSLERSRDSERRVPSSVVSVAFKIWIVSNVNCINATFTCKFRVFVEWLDEGAVGLPEGKKVDKAKLKDVNIPEIDVENAVEFKIVDKSSSPEVVNSNNGHLAYQAMYQATLICEYDLSLFPFDAHLLAVNLVMRNQKDQHRSFYFQYCEVDENIRLDEWSIHDQIQGACFEGGEHARAAFGITVQRMSRHYVNVMKMLFIFSTLSFSLFLIEIPIFQERAKVFILILLTLIMYKMSVENKLPKVPYSTAFDQYVISCQALFFALTLESILAPVMFQNGVALDDLYMMELFYGFTWGIIWFSWNTWFTRRAILVTAIQKQGIPIKNTLDEGSGPAGKEMRRSFSNMNLSKDKQDKASQGSTGSNNGNGQTSRALGIQVEDINSKLRFKKTQLEVGKKEKPPSRLVSLAAKITHLEDLETINATFKCRFRVFLEWNEEAAVGKEIGSRVKGLKVPELTLTNAVQYTVEDKEDPQVVNSETGHVAHQSFYEATLTVQLDVTRFPFDSQRMAIDLGMRSRKDRDRAFMIQYFDVDPSIELSEWILMEEFGDASIGDRGAKVSFGVIAQRHSRYYVINIMMMLFLNACMAFSIYVVELQKFHERAKIGLSICLAVVNFRLAVENRLPKVAYSTSFDHYSLAAQAVLIAAYFGHILARLIEYQTRGSGKELAAIVELSYGAILGVCWIAWNALFLYESFFKRRKKDDGSAMQVEANNSALVLMDQAALINKHLFHTSNNSSTNSVELPKPMRVVSVASNVFLIGDVDPVTSLQKVKFSVFFEWLDNKAKGLNEGKMSKSAMSKLDIPEISVLNAIECKIEGEEHPVVVNPETGHVAHHHLFQATLKLEFDLTSFPFDSQMLCINLGMRNEKDRDRAFFFQFIDVDESISLGEWNMHSTFAACENEATGAQVSFGMVAQRLWRYYIVVMVILGLISSLTFSTYVIEVGTFADRAKIWVSILMAHVCFKLSVIDKMPKAAYSTLFDQYAMSCQLVIFAIFVMQCICAQLVKYDAFSDVAKLVEFASAAFLGLLWIAWNSRFVCRAWYTKPIEQGKVQKLSPEIEARLKRRGSLSSADSRSEKLQSQNRKSRSQKEQQVSEGMRKFGRQMSSSSNDRERRGSVGSVGSLTLQRRGSLGSTESPKEWRIKSAQSLDSHLSVEEPMTPMSATFSRRGSLGSQDPVSPFTPSQSVLHTQLITLNKWLRFKRREAGSLRIVPASQAIMMGFKISGIDNLDPIRSTFRCKFTVYMEWLDPWARGEPEGQRIRADKLPKINIPAITIQNALQAIVEMQNPSPLVVDSESGHLAFEISYLATMHRDFDMTLFPFDSQWLELVIGLHSIKDQHRAVKFQFCDVAEDITLGEWTVHSTFAEHEADIQGPTRVTFGCLVQRMSRYYVRNVILILFLMSSLTFSLYVLRIQAFFDRVKVFMTILVAQITFKLSVESRLPKVSYATAFDRYLISCQVVFFTFALGNVVACELAKMSEISLAVNVELVAGLVILVFWVLWNLRFVYQMWRVKRSQRENIQTLPNSMQRKRCVDSFSDVSHLGISYFQRKGIVKRVGVSSESEPEVPPEIEFARRSHRSRTAQDGDLNVIAAEAAEANKYFTKTSSR